jgi:hypothetical protein
VNSPLPLMKLLGSVPYLQNHTSGSYRGSTHPTPYPFNLVLLLQFRFIILLFLSNILRVFPAEDCIIIFILFVLYITNLILFILFVLYITHIILFIVFVLYITHIILFILFVLYITHLILFILFVLYITHIILFLQLI